MATPFNESNYIKRKDYGVKVARPYYDVRNCADNQLLFNSSWPILQIAGVFNESIIKVVNIGQEPPSGAIFYGYTPMYDYEHCAVDSKYVYSSIGMYTYAYQGSFFYTVMYSGAAHNLGYPPLAFRYKDMGDFYNYTYAIVTTIDISKDVDYPYTEAPLEYFGGELDYGIKTKAYYRKDMPHSSEILGYGINSRLSSKMVQAVKTEETIQDGGINNKYIYWEPPRDEQNKLLSGVDDFEYYAYGVQTPLQPSMLDGVYYPITHSVYPIGGSASSADFVSTMQVTSGVQFSKQSLVVIRSPMVSPKVVEVNYGS